MTKDKAANWTSRRRGSAVKDAVGGLTGNTKLQAEGKMDKAAGKVQKKVGALKDDARKALKN